MKLAILLLLALIGLIFGFFLYRVLVHSKRFAKLIGGAVEPPPETVDEVINRLDDIEGQAHDHATRCDATARMAKDAGIEIRRRLPKRTADPRKRS